MFTGAVGGVSNVEIDERLFTEEDVPVDEDLFNIDDEDEQQLMLEEQYMIEEQLLNNVQDLKVNDIEESDTESVE